MFEFDNGSGGDVKILRQSIRNSEFVNIVLNPVELNIPPGQYKFISGALYFAGTVPMSFTSPVFVISNLGATRYCATNLLNPAGTANYAAMFDTDLDYPILPGVTSYFLTANSYLAGDCDAELILLYVDL